jgi:hypothetical protein
MEGLLAFLKKKALAPLFVFFGAELKSKKYFHKPRLGATHCEREFTVINQLAKLSSLPKMFASKRFRGRSKK